MRYESTVTSLSWIPSEAVTRQHEGRVRGRHRALRPAAARRDRRARRAGRRHSRCRHADRFRFANVLSAWIETDADGRITAAGYRDDSHGLMGSTTVKVGAARRTFQAVALPDLQREPEHGDGWVRFTQTIGGKTGRARAAARRPPAVRAVAGADRVDHADADPARGRAGGDRGARREPVPPALGLRRRRPAGPQVGSHRLRRVVPQVVRQAHAVGRRGLLGAGGRGGDRARAVAVG